jgi:divalent metal cation (Fe/Co/Zn/Cd) transporter
MQVISAFPGRRSENQLTVECPCVYLDLTGKGDRVDRPTRRTVLAAGLANVTIAAVKLVAGIAVGSAAMLAEAAHSLADTLNQGLLLTSLHRSGRPADAAHPFGYGKERYVWSLLAAVSRMYAAELGNGGT